MPQPRVAVIGAGAFGQNHCRVVHESARAQLAAIVDTDAARAHEAAARYQTTALTDARDLPGKIDAAIIAAPTTVHADLGCYLLDAGIDLLVEKPIASDLASADRLIEAAARAGRILQVGHLERFNPAVLALEQRVTLPLFFEIHRMNLFSPRSLDVDVVLDLMIHDVDLVLALANAEPEEIRAAGISILSGKVDIANVRLQFPNGCVANLTASRISTERVRKLRLFQPGQYLSLDYARQDLAVFSVSGNRQIGFEQAPVAKGEPLQLQFDAFLNSLASRSLPKSSGTTARRTLAAALAILDKIEEHAEVVSKTLIDVSEVDGWKP
jgi:predicted dehydrogenase